MSRPFLDTEDPEALAREIAAASQADRRAGVESLAQEVVRLMRVDTRRALVIADRAKVVAAEIEDPRCQARADWVRGHALSGVLETEAASDSYARAAAAYRDAGDPLTAARVSIGHVNTLMYLADYDSALEIGERARTVLMRHGEIAASARLDMNLGNIFFRLERPTEALRKYDRALRATKQLDDTSGMLGPIQFNRANALTNLGQFERAERLYREVRVDAEAGGETRTIGFVDYSLGYLEMLRGEYGDAWEALDSARGVFEELGDVHYLTLALADLAELFVEVNAFQRAKPLARQANTLAERHQIRFESARTALLQAIAALGLEEHRQAATFLQDAARAFRAEGNRASSALATVYLAELRTRDGEVADARRLLEEAADVFRRERMPLREAATRVRLASSLLEMGHLEAAAGAVKRARQLLRRTHSSWVSARLDHLAGRLAIDQRRFGWAVRYLRRAVDQIEGTRGRIGLDEFRVSYSEDKAPVYADLVRAILAKGGRGAVDAAFEVVERSRSRALVDLLAGRLRRARENVPAATGSLLTRLEKLRGEMSWLSGFEPNSDGGQRRRDEARLGRSRAALRARELEMADVVQRLHGRDAALGALTCGETQTLAEVRESLSADATLVEYYVQEHGTIAFIVTEAGARVVSLAPTRSSLAAAMSRLRFQIEKQGYGDAYVQRRERPLGASLDAQLRSLAADLWAPLEIDTERVVVVPHGPLHSLPFAALLDAEGTPLLEHHEITLLPSASSGRYLRERNGANDEAGVLAVGVGDASIPLVDHEVKRVRRLFRRGRTLRGPRATRERFLEQAPSAQVIHVATHGVFREDDPHFSALRFADGWMSVYDLYGLQLSADLVCLSACQSGRSWIGGGDELVGLARGFLHAGASTLVVSLWPVQDESTADLMERFYRELRGGARAETALRTAMRGLRAERPHPYHWAPFVLIGRGGVVTPAA